MFEEQMKKAGIRSKEELTKLVNEFVKMSTKSAPEDLKVIMELAIRATIRKVIIGSLAFSSVELVKGKMLAHILHDTTNGAGDQFNNLLAQKTSQTLIEFVREVSGITDDFDIIGKKEDKG